MLDISGVSVVCLAILQENRKAGNVKLGKTASGFVVVPNCCPLDISGVSVVCLAILQENRKAGNVNCCPQLLSRPQLLSPTAVPQLLSLLITRFAFGFTRKYFRVLD